MKIVHLADTHLGYRAFSGKLDSDRRLNQRECDVYDRWHEATKKAIELAPDIVIHAGDLFDSSRPAPRAIAEALDGFARLRKADIPVVVIAGNHETPRFRSGGSVFEILERFGIKRGLGETTSDPDRRPGSPRSAARARCRATRGGHHVVDARSVC
jgi:DNA repair exonuclease SbcCD nuclease subunit